MNTEELIKLCEIVSETCKEIKEIKYTILNYVPYQACPICNGKGRIAGNTYGNTYSTSVFSTCPTCNGQRIIPMYVVKENNKS